MKRSLAIMLLVLPFTALGQDWQLYRLAGVTVRAMGLDQSQLDSLRRALGGALADLKHLDSFEPCVDPTLTVHPDLVSYQSATAAGWFQLAVADRDACSIDLQRLPIVAEHGGLDRTLRHELHHLARPAGWERWRAEGEAQRFAGERPTAPVLTGVGPEELDRLLAQPPSQDMHLRAMATAYAWVLQGR